MDVNEKIKHIEQQIENAVNEVESSKSLFEVKMRFLGKTGEISELLKSMREVPPRRAADFGQGFKRAAPESRRKV